MLPPRASQQLPTHHQAKLLPRILPQSKTRSLKSFPLPQFLQWMKKAAHASSASTECSDIGWVNIHGVHWGLRVYRLYWGRELFLFECLHWIDRLSRNSICSLQPLSCKWLITACSLPAHLQPVWLKCMEVEVLLIPKNFLFHCLCRMETRDSWAHKTGLRIEIFQYELVVQYLFTAITEQLITSHLRLIPISTKKGGQFCPKTFNFLMSHSRHATISSILQSDCFLSRYIQYITKMWSVLF